MMLFNKAADLKTFLLSCREKGYKTGFVPTMGALHQGHLALVRRAVNENEISVCSIFVNPTQFNDPKDFEMYPNTFDEDRQLLESAGCTILFHPPVEEIYPPGYRSSQFELGRLGQVLEGRYRPGHFQGVCEVVSILLDIVQPDRLYMGQKDYQQCLVVRKLLGLKGMDSSLMRICETVREKSGLAMSSRNLRLSATEREQAAAIYRCLSAIKKNISQQAPRVLIDMAAETLRAAGLDPEYVEIANAESLETASHWDGKQQLVALVAARLNEVRLIDNLPLTDNPAEMNG